LVWELAEDESLIGLEVGVWWSLSAAARGIIVRPPSFPRNAISYDSASESMDLSMDLRRCGCKLSKSYS